MKIKFLSASVFFIILAIIGFSVFLSCNKNTGVKNVPNNKDASNNQVKVLALNSHSAKLLKAKIIQWQFDKLGSLMSVNNIIKSRLTVNSVGAGSDSTGFNFDSLSMVVINSDTAIMAKQIGATSNYGYYAAYYMTNTAINSSLIVKVDSLSENNIQINYYNANQILLFTAQTNTQTGVSDIIYTYSDAATNSTSKLQTSSLTTFAASGGCGQGTANCLTDVYSNHGWLSVWATVQSAVIPATVVALAAACANGHITILGISIICYALIYRPLIDGYKLIFKGLITRKEIWKMYLPSTYRKYFKELYMS